MNDGTDVFLAAYEWDRFGADLSAADGTTGEQVLTIINGGSFPTSPSLVGATITLWDCDDVENDGSFTVIAGDAGSATWVNPIGLASGPTFCFYDIVWTSHSLSVQAGVGCETAL